MKAPDKKAPDNAPRSEQRIPYDAFLKQYGRGREAGRQWRQRMPWLDVKNIFGRLYISLESVRRFEEMASRGELAVRWKTPQPRRPGRPRKVASKK
jgi:hypothetical protein